MDETIVPEPAVVEELMCGCGGKGKCPRIAVLSDGGVRIDDPDAGGAPVLFTEEQASQLREELERRGY